MINRRRFFKYAAGGALQVAACTQLLAAANPFSKNANQEKVSNNPSAPPITFKGNDLGKVMALGGVPLAGGWKPTPDDDSYNTLETAWNLGIRYYDTSPRYGYGVSERRVGIFLDEKDPDEFIISTKVGRLLKPRKGGPKEEGMWPGRHNAYTIYDYSASGARLSVEESLQRLGLSKVDIVYIHDLTPDNGEIAGKYEYYFNQAAKGAIPELEKMKEEGLIKAWGFGVNNPDAALRSLSFSQPDICLMATQYSILDHDMALENTFPKLSEHGVKVAAGSTLNCGYVCGNNRWNYTGQPAPNKIVSKYHKMKAIAKDFEVDLRTAGLQFSMAHPIVTSVVVGARSAKQIAQDYHSLHGDKVPGEFWEELSKQNLIHKKAIIPKA